MSRVWGIMGEKYVNTVKFDSKTTAPTKVRRSKAEYSDYTKAKTLTSWLYLKYNMSYKTFRRKKPERRSALRDEFLLDTGTEDKSEQKREGSPAAGC